MVNTGAGRTDVGGSLLLYGDFFVRGTDDFFNPQAPGLDVLAGATIAVDRTSSRLVVSHAGSLRNAGTINVTQGGALKGERGPNIENLGEVEVQAGGTLRLEGNQDESFYNMASGTLRVSGLVSGSAQSRLFNHGTLIVAGGGSVTVPDIRHAAGQLTIESGATLATPGGGL